MKTFVVLALALTAAQALNYDQEWELFKARYERNYLSTPEVIMIVVLGRYSSSSPFLFYMRYMFVFSTTTGRTSSSITCD